MKTVIKKKIWQGMVELRDDEVKKYVGFGKPIKVVVGNEYMILTTAQLEKGRVTNTQYSIYNEGQKYLLVGFKWKGIPFKEEEAGISTDVKLRLAQEFRAKYGKN